MQEAPLEFWRFRVSQVVVGVLGCPNMPSAIMTDEDGTALASEAIGEKGRGMCFLAQKGGGAFKGLLTESLPTEPMQMIDLSDCSKGRWMESYESRHSSHGITAAVVSTNLWSTASSLIYKQRATIETILTLTLMCARVAPA